MPGRDGTGPNRDGPMSGRGMGFCVMQLDDADSSGVKGFAGSYGKPVYKTNMKSSPAWESSSQKEEVVMPAGDGTGPMGMGAMTGRAAGFCAGYGMPGYMNGVAGRGFGMGFGRGRGFGGGGGRGRRNMYYATGMTGWQRAGFGGGAWGGYPAYPQAPTREQEMDALKDQVQYFESTLGDLRKRLQEIESEKEAK